MLIMSNHVFPMPCIYLYSPYPVCDMPRGFPRAQAVREKKSSPRMDHTNCTCIYTIYCDNV